MSSGVKNRTLVLKDLLAQFGDVPKESVDEFARATFYGITALGHASEKPAYYVPGKVVELQGRPEGSIDVIVTFPMRPGEECRATLSYDKASLVSHPLYESPEELVGQEVMVCMSYMQPIGFAIPHSGLGALGAQGPW